MTKGGKRTKKRRKPPERPAHFQTDKTKNIKTTTTTIQARDLTKQAPHSPRDRINGFALAARAADKCRASAAGTDGEYHFDWPLDNMLVSFKGITGAQFKTAVTAVSAAKNDGEIGAWLQNNGTKKSVEEIKAWSDGLDAGSLMKNPEKRDAFVADCKKLGLNPETSTTFDWLDAGDRASFRPAASAKN